MAKFDVLLSASQVIKIYDVQCTIMLDMILNLECTEINKPIGRRWWRRRGSRTGWTVSPGGGGGATIMGC